jgi:acyl-CoA synthetase (AMP-forming)/AMP-acid ligase II
VSFPVPTSIAIPAAIAGAAYLNARFRFPEDRRTLGALVAATVVFNRRLKKDRLNSFYYLQEHATNPKIANETFVIYNGKSWTFKETYDLSLRYAGWLRSKHNVQQGEYVAIDFMNSAQFLFIVLALWSLGAHPALLNYNLTADPFLHCVRTSSARLLLLDPEIAPKVLTEEVKAALTTIRTNALPVEVCVLTAGLQSSLDYFPPYLAPDSARAGPIGRDVCALISTSGTTGLPKAAVVSWEKIHVSAGAIARWGGWRPVTSKSPDRYYSAMPLYHSSAFMLNFHLGLMQAVTIVISRKFSVTNFWPEVIASKATVVQYVGETLRYLLATPPSPDDKTKHKVRMAFGNGLRADVWDKFRSRFGVDTIAEFYGATEGVGGTFSFSRNTFSSGAMGQQGPLLALMAMRRSAVVQVDWDAEVPYRDPKTGFCVALPKGQIGELITLLDAEDVGARFQGYHNNPDASMKKVLRDVFKKGDAWYRSGDVIRIDKENRIYFSDRIGDTFRWKSENVSTAEVGDVLGHHRLVLEANVYGVPVPGHEGRAGCAAILLTPGSLLPSGEVKEDVLESLATWCTNSLPKYGVPLFLRVVQEVVATGNNKQQKTGLRKEGIDPSLTGSDRVYWLKPGSSMYKPFGRTEWDQLGARKVKL